MTTCEDDPGIQRLLDFTAAEPPGPADIASKIRRRRASPATRPTRRRVTV